MKTTNKQDISWNHVLYNNDEAIKVRENRETEKQVWNSRHYQVQESINDESE